MNGPQWQSSVVALIVGAALLHLALRAWRACTSRTSHGCHGCRSRCQGQVVPTANDAMNDDKPTSLRPLPFVGIDALERRDASSPSPAATHASSGRRA